MRTTALAGLCAGILSAAGIGEELPKGDGYRGIWYMNQPTKDEYRYKYSGGMATYPQQHAPIAVYAPAADKTFFVYGGVAKGGRSLLHMVAYYDHKSGRAARPRILLDKKTTDAHDNPVLSIDRSGRLWIFSPSHGTARPSYIHRSIQPYDISEFERVLEGNFSYPQPWNLGADGFLFLHTLYASGRGLHWRTSLDGLEWSEPRPLAKIVQGDYQVSWAASGRVATAFDYHPKALGLNARTNIYYLETHDAGASWRTVSGARVDLPISDARNPALVRDFESEGKLVYLKDLNFDLDGRPVILFLTSKGYQPGPSQGPHEWQTARWTGEEWEFCPIAASDHNYDHGSLYIEPDGTWRLIAPTEPGPQAYGTGGQMALWTSGDRGARWTRVKQLTHDERYNHSYARRPVHAREDFYALWAAGDAFAPSDVGLYFTDKLGSHVWRLPESMDADFAEPEVVW